MEALIVLIVFGSFFGTIISWRYLRHREKMAELDVRRVEALAKADTHLSLSLPAERATLAKELLAAYDEADSSLRR